MHQRPKVEMKCDHLFVIARAHIPGTLDTRQVAMFPGGNLVITFQETNVDCLETVRKRIEAAKGQIRERGADSLLDALIDIIVDGYFRHSKNTANGSMLWTIAFQGKRNGPASVSFTMCDSNFFRFGVPFGQCGKRSTH